MTEDAPPTDWKFQLPRGIYKVVINGVGEQLFEVTGAVAPDGSASEVNVTV